MTKDTLMRLHRIFNIIIAISVVITGVLFCAGCLSIYNSGDRPYSRDAVAAAFGRIAIPVYVSIVLTVLGFVFELASPLAKKKEKSRALAKRAELLLSLKEKEKEAESRDEFAAELHCNIAKERKMRLTVGAVTSALTVASLAVFLVYCLNSAHFGTENITGDVISAMYVMVPCLGAAFALSVASAYIRERSLNREKAYSSRLGKDGKDKEEKDGFAFFKSSKFKNALRIAIVAIAVAAVVFGVVFDGTTDVLTKAVNICTECIGLG